MARKKTSQAVIKSVRLNPINEHERAVLEIIDQLESEEYNFKQIVVDAILRANGYTPEMFARPFPNDILGHLERMLEQFAHEIIQATQNMRGGGRYVEDEGETTSFAQNFARSFIDRQRKAQGGDE